MVIPHPALEPTPLAAWLAIVQQEVGTVLVGRVFAAARPVVVRHHIAQRNVVLMHQGRAELGGALDGSPAAVAPVLTHLHPDRVAVAGSVKVGVFSLLVGWHVLHHPVFVDGVVPDQVANAVATAAAGRAQGSALERQGMLLGIGLAAVVLGAVDSDVARRHGPHHPASVAATGHHVLDQIDLAPQLVQVGGARNHRVIGGHRCVGAVATIGVTPFQGRALTSQNGDANAGYPAKGQVHKGHPSTA